MSPQADPNSSNFFKTDSVDECIWPPFSSALSAASVLLLLR